MNKDRPTTKLPALIIVNSVPFTTCLVDTFSALTPSLNHVNFLEVIVPSAAGSGSSTIAILQVRV